MSPQSFPSAPGPREPIRPPSLPFQSRLHRRASAGDRGSAGVPASVRFCPVDPAATDDERIAAAVRVIVTAYSAPGERVALADAANTAEPATRAARVHRDRLVETVLRLARGATTERPRRSLADAPRDGDRAGPGVASEPGPGPGLGRDRRPEADTEPIGLASVGRAQGTRPDRFTVIICGCTPRPPEPGSIADWAPLLAPDGALIVLTHSNQQSGARSARSGAIGRAAALTGLTLTDRLILAHQAPSATPPTTRHVRRAVALGGHRRTHATACVFRPSTPTEETRHA